MGRGRQRQQFDALGWVRGKKLKDARRWDRRFAAIFIPASLALIVGILVLIWIWFSPDVDHVVPVAGEVKIPVDEVHDGRAHFFAYEATAGKTVRFFIIESPPGTYRTALDASERKSVGFHRRGNCMACNGCGRLFPIAKVGEVSGDDYPVALSHRVEAGQLVISQADLDGASRYFAKK